MPTRKPTSTHPSGESSSVNGESRRLVLLLTDTLSNGGAERQLALLAQGMIRRGWAVRVWSLGDGPYRRALEEAGIDVSVVVRRWRWDVSPALSLTRLIRSSRPSVVLAWSWMSGLAALPACRALQVPFVGWNIRSATPNPRRRWFHRLLLRRADLCVANSRAGLQVYAVPPEKGRVVYNGFDMGRLAGLQDKTTNDQPFRVCMTGRMVREKDYRAFIEVAADVMARSAPSPWLFLLIGDGSDRPSLETMARRALPPESYAFLAPGLEVLPLVAGCDVGVLLTDARYHSEGCSNSIIEYMACGLPVVCSDSGGNKEVVEDGLTGLIVPAGDRRAAVRALLSLRADADLRGRMGQASKARVAERFSLDALVESTFRVLEELGVDG